MCPFLDLLPNYHSHTFSSLPNMETAQCSSLLESVAVDVARKNPTFVLTVIFFMTSK